MKYRIRATRLVEQECEFFIDVPKNWNEEQITDAAVDTAEEVASLVWTQEGSTAPHTINIEKIEPMDKDKDPCPATE